MGLIERTREVRVPFLLGLALRIALIALFVPQTYVDWFVPFLSGIGSRAGWDIWTAHLLAGGSPLSFPYGPPYLLVYGPLTWLGGCVGPRVAALGLMVTVLALDWLLLRTLILLGGMDRARLVVLAYWWSPLVLYVCYWHGQLDILPVLLLAAGLVQLRDRDVVRGGLAIGLAASAKFSMGLAIPFVWLATGTTLRLRPLLSRLILWTAIGGSTLLPFLAIPGFRAMVLGTPEAAKVFGFALPYAGNQLFYLAPLAILALLYAAWRIRRFNFEILFSLVGLAFFSLFLLTPASPGWVMWLVPFLVYHQLRGPRSSWLLVAAFSGLFVVSQLLLASGPVGVTLYVPLPAHVQNLMLSLYLALGGAIMFQLSRQRILDTSFYRNTRHPLVIGIAGDSGAGKDTLASALFGLFGGGRASLVSGDDYHLWDRHKPMWRALTHLNPRANDLRRFTSDALLLARGWPIHAPHYDHRLGAMTKPRPTTPGDVVIAAGLHALTPRELLHRYDLGIYLAMDEELRRFLKIRRDVTVRGHLLETVLSSLARREVDSDRYIRPQANVADLIFAVRPVDRRDIADPLAARHAPRLALAIETEVIHDLQPLVRQLVALGGVCALEAPGTRFAAQIEIEGDPTADDIAGIARCLLPQMYDYLAMEPVWNDGLLGIMQLAFLHQLSTRISIQGAA